MSCHSALVTLGLVIGEQSVPLAQAAHDFAIAKEPTELPVGIGEIIRTVDGRITRIPVRLQEGCKAGQKRFAISAPAASGTTPNRMADSNISC